MLYLPLERECLPIQLEPTEIFSNRIVSLHLHSLKKRGIYESKDLKPMRVILVNSDRLSSFSYQLEWGGFVR
jgi:hypothetical protein